MPFPTDRLAAEPETEVLGERGQQPAKPNQTIRATTIEGPDPPNLVQRMFGGYADHHFATGSIQME